MIQVYKTKDGQVFDLQEDAARHEGQMFDVWCRRQPKLRKIRLALPANDCEFMDGRGNFISSQEIFTKLLRHIFDRSYPTVTGTGPDDWVFEGQTRGSWSVDKSPLPEPEPEDLDPIPVPEPEDLDPIPVPRCAAVPAEAPATPEEDDVPF